jgi:phosphatidylinositol-3-phosphatase
MATPFKSIGPRTRSWFTARQQRPMRKQDKRCRPRLEGLEERTLLSFNAAIGDVFYIDMENHNLTQPSNVPPGTPEQLLGNPAAPYLNSLITPGNPNAAQTSYASNYYNVLYNNPAVSIHPSEPNYVWQEGGSNFGVANDDDPYANNGNADPNLNNNVKLIAATGNNPANLSALLQAAGIPWKSYQEDIDLTPTSGSVNQPGANSLTSTVAPQSQWTVPTSSFSGTSTAYTNPYNGSNQYNFAVKHDGQLFYTATNGGTLSAPNFSPSNPEAQFYAPLQQLQTDLNNNTVARYNLITPDQYNDMHSSLNTDFTYNGVTYTNNTDQEAVALGDNFLSKIIPMIEASQAYKNNGAIVIWYDESEGGNTTQFTLPEIVISPLAKGNAYDSTLTYTHSSDLKSLQELFGVSAPGGGFLGDANTPGTNDLSDLFLPPPGATVQGNTLYLVGGNTNDQLNIKPIGASQTGSTGIKVNGQLNGVNINNQTFTGVTTIYVVGFGGNDNFQFAGSLTIPSVVRADDGNDQIRLDNGNNTVNLGDGNDQVNQGGGSTQGGNGNNTVTAGNGNDQIQLGNGNDNIQGGGGRTQGGNGNNTITAGNGNDQVQLGNGNNTVTLGTGNDNIQLGNGTNTVTAGAVGSLGNIQVQLGNGNNDNASITGDGNDHIQVGNGNNDNASITGDGNDHIQVGNGNSGYVLMVGDGNDDIQTGTGSGKVHVAGSGHKNLHLGSGWTQV